MQTIIVAGRLVSLASPVATGDVPVAEGLVSGEGAAPMTVPFPSGLPLVAAE